ncbi:hypothetical protein [Sphingomonas bacterium]|uniref:hypothetical protein n=1 Tax=Sphingomonas bacterium TaxID=1895847 RepID=UPI00157614CD|nr:hypothetical protein [Sphingomonas bacterium]
MLRTPLAMAAIMLTAPALAQTTTPAPDAATPAATTAPATPNVTAGAQVVDTAGAAVGSIESVTNGIATLSTGTTKVGIPIASFAAGDGKLVLAMTKAQIDAKGAPAAQASAAASAAAAPVAITVGTAVKDQAGAKVGTIKAVNGDMVTVASETASAQLPKSSFAKGPDGLMIGLTAAQFEAAAKAAGGGKPAGSTG